MRRENNESKIQIMANVVERISPEYAPGDKTLNDRDENGFHCLCSIKELDFQFTLCHSVAVMF